MTSAPSDFEAVVLENRPVGGAFRLRLEDSQGFLSSALPGQFVNLRVQPGYSPLLRRPFSIARLLPGRGRALQLEVLYAVVREGTRLLSVKKPGETVGVLGPLGNPFPHLDRRHPALLVGGGIGVAPLIYLAETLGCRKVPFAVFLGARTKKDLLGLDVFRKLGAPLFLATDDGTGGRRGFVTELVKEHLDSGKAPQGSVIHACGPRPMFRALASVAAARGIVPFLGRAHGLRDGHLSHVRLPGVG